MGSLASTVLSYPRRQRDLEALLLRMGLDEGATVDWVLLDRALTHPTADSQTNYEQLEFVGDAIVRTAAAELLWETYPDWPVGEMAAARAILVSDRMLARIADTYNLERYLIMGGSAARDLEGRQSRLADALEATIGALYLSVRSLDLVRPWLDDHFRAIAHQVRNDPARQNYKAALQEWTQGRYKSLPEYRVRELSAVHGDVQRFEAQVWFHGRCLGQGRGRSRKLAEQAAAQEAFLWLCDQDDLPNDLPSNLPGDLPSNLPGPLPGDQSSNSPGDSPGDRE